MMTLRRVMSLACMFISVAALLIALFGQGVMRLLVGMFTLGQASGATSYPLGLGVIAVYLCGLALGLAVPRWPSAAGLAMLPLGAIAYLFGGPVAQYFGVAVCCIGVVLLAAGLRQKVNAGNPRSTGKT